MNTHRGRRRLLTLAIGLSLVAPIFPPARAATVGVDEIGTSFEPRQIDIAVNDRVVWTNRSSQSHTVTFDGGTDLNPRCDPNTAGLLRVGCQTPGSTVELSFTAPGTYPYRCKLHGSQGMTGVVVVTATTTTATSAASASTSTTIKASSTTMTTAKATSSTTSTTRALATSSTVLKSTTTTSDTSSAVLPGAPPPFSNDDSNSNASGKTGGSTNGSDSRTVALIVSLLLAVSAGGGYLLWRLRPGRA